MANHNKNKRFGAESFQRFHKARPIGQDAMEREAQRRKERQHVSKPIDSSDDDFFSTYSDENE